MKKLLTLGIAFVLTAAVASAQSSEKLTDHGRRKGDITRLEHRKMKNDHERLHRMEKRAHRDGKVGPRERRNLHKMRKHNRHQAYRFKHNKHKRHHARMS